MLEELRKKLLDNDFNAVIYGDDHLVVDAYGCSKVSVVEEESEVNGTTLNVYYPDGSFFPADSVDEAYEHIAYCLQF